MNEKTTRNETITPTREEHEGLKFVYLYPGRHTYLTLH